MKVNLTILIISLVATGTLCSSDLREQAEKMIQARKDSIERLPVFLEAMKQAEHLELIEGLPRRKNEREKEEEIFKVRGYRFYKRIVQASEQHKDLIKNILSDESTYRVYGGVKLCGGFHPDFCVGVQSKDKTFQYLICFGCHEVKAYNGDLELYAEFTDEGYDALYELLMLYRGKESTQRNTKSKAANQSELSTSLAPSSLTPR